MNNFHRLTMAGAVIAVLLAYPSAGAKHEGYSETDLVVNQKVNNTPTLVDANGIVHIAKFFDPNLVNPWGVGESSSTPFWVSDNGAGLSTLYNTAGAPQSRVVSIPAPGDPLGASGAQTGLVFNIASAQQGFTISGVTSGGLPTKAPAVFLFATEDGTILGWNPGVNPPGFAAANAGNYAITAVDNSGSGAVYKGLAIATDASGATHLYATDFHSGAVEVYDSQFKPVNAPGAFLDPSLPRGYAPFNIAPVSVNGGTKLFVTYALQDADKKDDVAGESHGIVDTFDLSGQALERFAQHGQLNSPWGVTRAPASFGEFGGAVLIGNFGNGHINAFDPESGRFLGKVRDAHGQAIVIDGLWSLLFGNGGNGGDVNTLYFTAGPNDEEDGLFGSLSPN